MVLTLTPEIEPVAGGLNAPAFATRVPLLGLAGPGDDDEDDDDPVTGGGGSGNIDPDGDEYDGIDEGEDEDDEDPLWAARRSPDIPFAAPQHAVL
jgi:hypothetical protein